MGLHHYSMAMALAGPGALVPCFCRSLTYLDLRKNNLAYANARILQSFNLCRAIQVALHLASLAADRVVPLVIGP
ncbi:hypothetical protein CDL15_Pgr026611 [Punica granatum]|uniref:Uncharacterized protein n=1 Tax=Punica granatum TaxID=22663 RepID=A0A218WNE7_PUNGR|nr:hypothetical protein CDL15_Pgr026611 [Punica granatum]